MKEKYRVIVDPEYGYRRLDPLPTPEELKRFYKNEYYDDLIAAGSRGPDLRRLMRGGEERRSELVWLSKTLWRDIRDVIEHLNPKKERVLLDIGCGPGYFGQYMREAGWHVIGVEPARDAAKVARSFGMVVYDSLEECASQINQRFNAVTLLSVLEHVLDPAGLLQSVRPLMAKKGILIIRVPNDFSLIQECAHRQLQCDPWWIAIPDHINYFNFESLVRFLEKLNFQVVDMFGDFPMEMFLLFGDIYVGNPEVGSQCHRKRVAFELSLPVEVRRNLYRCFARNGLGRECLVFARPMSSVQ